MTNFVAKPMQSQGARKHCDVIILMSRGLRTLQRRHLTQKIMLNMKQQRLNPNELLVRPY